MTGSVGMSTLALTAGDFLPKSFLNMLVNQHLPVLLNRSG
jgi:hypothetical protein